MSGYVGDSWEPPIGHFIDVAGTDVPDGYLLCDGSAISRTTYARLFAKIGTRYGYGDGNTTFNLPAFGNADTLRLPTGKRFSASMLNWIIGTAGGTVSLLSATQLNILGANPNYGCTKGESGRKSGRVCLAFLPSLVVNITPGMGYLYVGFSKWAGAVTSTLRADIAANYHHYIRIQYTTAAGGAVTINAVHQVNNGSATLISGFTPAWGEKWFIQADLSAQTWQVKTSGGSTASLTNWNSMGDTWYPFVQSDSLNSISVQLITAASMSAGELAILADYTAWADFADVLSGATSGSATHTHTIQGTTLTAAQVPEVTPAGNATAGGGTQSSPITALQTAATAASSHTHTAVAANSMPPTIHALCAIKYR